MPVAVQPVSEAPPTKEDHKRTLALESFLEEHGRVERGRRGCLREAVLTELGEIVRQWMARLCAARISHTLHAEMEISFQQMRQQKIMIGH